MAILACAHQPNYLPYAGFFHKMAQADVFVIADTVQFVKRGTFGWMHRNRIRTHDGWQWLSLPVVTSGRRFQLCHEAQLHNDLPWAHKHWRTIELNYRKAPGFADAAPDFHAVYQKDWEFVADLACELIAVTARHLDITTPMVRASEVGISGEGEGGGALIADICRYAGTNRYLSGVHGHDYLDTKELAELGVNLEFQDYTPPVYAQCQPGAFIPNLSALDLIFCAGRDAPSLLRRGG